MQSTKPATKPAAKPASKSASTSTSKSTSNTSKPASAAEHDDAIKMLMADHKEVKALFKAYDKLVNAAASGAEKGAIATEICTKLTVHATVEEELFYPAAREVLAEHDDLIDEATVEHASAKDLIAQIESATPGDALYDAKVKVLGEFIDHHVKEEEGEMFPKLRKSGLDLEGLGAEMAARKEELIGQLEEA